LTDVDQLPKAPKPVKEKELASVAEHRGNKEEWKY
jgi:hypothetical protein